MSAPWDAIVIGAGFGGVGCAARLAEAGWRVLVLDKNARPGGKALGVSRAGSHYELWPIAGGPARRSRFHELARLVGVEQEALLCPDAVCEFLYLDERHGRRRSVVVPARPVADPRVVARLAYGLRLPLHRLGGALRLGAALSRLTEADLDALDATPASAWLRRHGLPRPLESFFFALLNLLFVVPVDALPASEAARMLRQLQLGGAGRYHRGGYGSLAEAAVRYVERRGGRFRGGTRVERVLVEGGRAVGVQTQHGAERAPVIISSAGLQPTVLKLVGAAHFEQDYVSYVRGLRPSWALVGVRYRLSERVFHRPMTYVFSDESWLDAARFEAARQGRWPRHPLLFVTVPALWDPALAQPPVRQVALLGGFAPAGLDDPMQREVIARLEQSARRLWPTLERSVLGRERYDARHVSRISRDAVLPGQGGECIGLGQVLGQCGRSKPSPQTPLPGLWLAGADAGASGCGTHQALDSGMLVGERLSARRTHDARREGW